MYIIRVGVLFQVPLPEWTSMGSELTSPPNGRLLFRLWFISADFPFGTTSFSVGPAGRLQPAASSGDHHSELHDVDTYIHKV